jgi:hypothetical protein
MKFFISRIFVVLLSTSNLFQAQKLKTSKKLVYQIAMKEIGTCWSQTCYSPTQVCYNEECEACKTECFDSNPIEPTLTGKNGVEKTVSPRKYCMKTCRSEGRCQSKKDLPKSCKKCKKNCFREAIESSDSMRKFVVECKPFCDDVCWGPAWKTEACSECVTQNCAGELFKN